MTPTSNIMTPRSKASIEAAFKAAQSPKLTPEIKEAYSFQLTDAGAQNLVGWMIQAAETCPQIADHLVLFHEVCTRPPERGPRLMPAAFKMA